MSIPYERIVADDLNLGYGTVAVSMPGGGTALGTKIGLHTFTGFLNVKDFGAVGDGVTNDRAAIVAAYEALPGANHGGVVFFPPGVYAFPTTLNFIGTNVQLMGEGATLYFTGSGDAVQMDGDATATYGGGIVGLTIKGQSQCTNGLVIDNSHHGRFVNVTIQDVSAIAVQLTNSVCNYFENLRCSGNEQGTWGTRPVTGLKLVGYNCSANTFVNTIMEGVSGDGILFAGGVRNTFIGGTAEACARGITLPADSDYNFFQGIDCEANTTSDFDVSSGFNTFTNCLGASKVALGGIHIADGVSNVVINGMFHNVAVDAGALNTSLINVTYSLFGAPDAGAFVDAGSSTKISGLVNNQTSVVVDNLVTNGPAVITGNQTNNGTVSIARPAATDTALYLSKTAATADVTPRFSMTAAGGMSWGPGTSAVDTNLYRDGASILRTDDSFIVGIDTTLLGALNHDGSTVGFYGTAPITKPLLTTGSGNNVDAVITVLQNLGLVRQS